jgi:transcriptional regulator of acetoin/glycerol metabolism
MHAGGGHAEEDVARADVAARQDGAALDRADGNISETARQLGLTRRGLYLKLRRHGMDVSAGVDTQ